MDTFWADFWSPGAIARQILLMIAIPSLVYTFWRYWSYRSVKSIQRQLKGIEIQKTLTENFAKSEHFTLLFCFGLLFLLMAIVSLAFIIPGLSTIVEEKKLNPLNTIKMVIWISFCGISFAASQLLKKVEKYPESMEGFDKKTTKLMAKLSKIANKS
jgi:hypothetical protein